MRASPGPGRKPELASSRTLWRAAREPCSAGRLGPRLHLLLPQTGLASAHASFPDSTASGGRLGSGLARAMVDHTSRSDTSCGAAAAQLEVLRRMGPGGRLRAGLRFSRSMIALSRAALRARNPGLDERAAQLLWIEQNYGADLARKVERHQRAVGWTGLTISSPL